MNYNHHGLVFSINTLSAKNLLSGKTRKNCLICSNFMSNVPQPLAARHFITRALLGAENFAQAQIILRDNGVGAGNGCSINMTFLRQEGDRLFHNAEMGPAEKGLNQSQLNVFTASPGEQIIHANK